ncbi:MAG: hypothetical protein A2038_10700 [Deltaproteobacteria bacterium GWA2_57_13]|nr:MAG: hypothetical protein A2038_10700 [Deltaproteobacteria bacterium GWA2_57_13]OGQ78148.1 MAG: hypothetical protein A3G40_08665 [Deltaproteobacteria bacterium RIFCSPLOWO2_12_FULL_57_22]
MGRRDFSIGGSLLLVCVIAWGSTVAAASMDQLVAAAKQEGAVDFYAPSTLTPEGAKVLAQTFNKKFGTNIRVNYFASGSMTADVGKLVAQAATGVAPDWDLMVIIDALHGPLWQKKLHVPYDYGKLGADSRAVHYDNGTVSIANQVVLPGYNPKILGRNDVPKSWEDLLNPRWKGKIGVPTATGQMDFLAILWGEEKFIDFVRALAKQEPIPGKLAELATRLELGEISLASTLTDSFIYRAKKTGAPLEHAQIQPVVSPAYHAGVLKGARHPNAGHLLAAFLTAPEAQQIWEQYGGQSSAFVAGTKMYSYVQGKAVIYLTQKEVALVNRMVGEIGKILGFRR